MQIFFGIVYPISAMTILSVLMSMGLYLGAFTAHFKEMFNNMSHLVGNTSDKCPVIQTKIQLKAELIDAMKFHYQAKE